MYSGEMEDKDFNRNFKLKDTELFRYIGLQNL